MRWRNPWSCMLERYLFWQKKLAINRHRRAWCGFLVLTGIALLTVVAMIYSIVMEMNGPPSKPIDTSGPDDPMTEGIIARNSSKPATDSSWVENILAAHEINGGEGSHTATTKTFAFVVQDPKIRDEQYRYITVTETTTIHLLPAPTGAALLPSEITTTQPSPFGSTGGTLVIAMSTPQATSTMDSIQKSAASFSVTITPPSTFETSSSTATTSAPMSSHTMTAVMYCRASSHSRVAIYTLCASVHGISPQMVDPSDLPPGARATDGIAPGVSIRENITAIALAWEAKNGGSVVDPFSARSGYVQFLGLFAVGAWLGIW